MAGANGYILINKVTDMKRIILSIMIPAIAAHCFATVEPNDIKAVVKSNNTFGLNMYLKFRDEPGNIFFSPYSISTALAMTYAGARGRTEKEMANVLNVPVITDTACEGIVSTTWPQERYHAAFGEIINQLNTQGEKDIYKLVVANALWGQKGYSFLKEFTELIECCYQGGMNEVDFINETESSRREINEWVEYKTREKIKDLLQKGSIRTDTRLVLTNAIYFKGKWSNPFNKSITSKRPFYLSDGSEISVMMMRQTKRFRYASTEKMEVLELPYAGDELSMVIFLPAKGTKLQDIRENINTEGLSTWLNAINKRRVEVHLPRFTMTWEKELNDTLKSMGMANAFSDSADFSGMTDGHDLTISKVVHKAFVEVNEEGTEAAAATGVGMKITSVEPEPLVVFKADRPFVLLIIDNTTGSILFLGRVENPKA